MHSIIYLAILFIAKVIDNAINTTKTIMIQRSRWVLAGIAVILSDFIYFWIMRNVVTSNHILTMLIVAVVGGVGCSLACFMNDKLSKDRTYVNVIMSDHLEAMKELRDFLAEHHITNVATDSYTLDWNTKTIKITAYPETKAESRLINEYRERNGLAEQLIRECAFVTGLSMNDRKSMQSRWSMNRKLVVCERDALQINT